MSSFESSRGHLERNLVLVGLALEKGWIELHHITHAFTVWICDKTQSLGRILVGIEAISEDQKLRLEQLVEQKLIHDMSSVQTVSALENLEDLTSQLEFLQDADLGTLLEKAVSERRVQVSGVKHGYEDRKAHAHAPEKESFESFDGESFDDESSDRFQWRESLDEPGGMGELSIAVDKELNRLAVIKKIKPNRAADPLFRGLFQLEGEVTGHLEHPNIPPVYSLNKDAKGRDFFAMRYFKGKKLTEAIREYHVFPRSQGGKSREKLIELLQAFQTACLAVEFAHHRGVLHCDLKPDNIMVGPYGETLVIDWGLVFVTSGTNLPIRQSDRPMDGDYDSEQYSPSKSALTGLHQRQGGLRHSVGGTLPYMAPEQLQASRTKEIEKITCATDVFLLGATLYHLLTNRPPYLPKTKNRETASDLYDRIGRADSPSPRSIDPGIDQALESIVKKAMHFDPSKRYASPRQLADDIRLWLSDEPTIAHPDGLRAAIGRWMKRNLKTAISTAALAIFSLLVGSYFVYQENLKARENHKAWLEMARGRSELMRQTGPMFAQSNHYITLKKKYLQDLLNKYDKLMEYEGDNVDLLFDYFFMSLMYASVLRAEHDLPQAMRHWKAANRTLDILKTKEVLSPFMEKREVLEKAEVKLKRDFLLMEWQEGHLAAALKGFQEILTALDEAKALMVTRFETIEEVLATFAILKISEDGGFPQPDPQSIRLRLDGLRRHLDKTDWKNPEVHQALLFKTVITFNINEGVYDSCKLTDHPDFRKLVEIVGLYNSRTLTSDHLPETDYLFWVHGSIMDLVAHVADKSPSPDLVPHCEQALRFYDKLSSDYPKMMSFRSHKLSTMQRKAALEMALGGREAARFTAREGLKQSRAFLREFPDSSSAHLLVIHALNQNLNVNSDLPDSLEKKTWVTEAKDLKAQATNRWPEVIFGEGNTNLFRSKAK